MNLEDLIRKWIVGREEISERMAQYDSSPAIFFQAAPSDTQPRWSQTEQYPRIVYSVDMIADVERKTSGILRVDLLCDAAGAPPETIEPDIRAAMKDLIIKPAESSPYCFVWSRSEAFDLESNNSDKRIIGYELTFDILEYPEQITTDPDPVEAMNLTLKESFPDLCILWQDEIGEFTVATREHPVAYVRVISSSTDHISHALSWINCNIAVHIICPGADARLKWCRTISNFLAVSGEARMTDGSPLLFREQTGRNGSDYLINGQIELTTLYSLPRDLEEGILLRQTHRR